MLEQTKMYTSYAQNIKSSQSDQQMQQSVVETLQVNTLQPDIDRRNIKTEVASFLVAPSSDNNINEKQSHTPDYQCGVEAPVSVEKNQQQEDIQTKYVDCNTETSMSIRYTDDYCSSKETPLKKQPPLLPRDIYSLLAFTPLLSPAFLLAVFHSLSITFIWIILINDQIHAGDTNEGNRLGLLPFVTWPVRASQLFAVSIFLGYTIMFYLSWILMLLLASYSTPHTHTHSYLFQLYGMYPSYGESVYYFEVMTKKDMSIS